MGGHYRERWVKAAGTGEVEHLRNLGRVMKVLETVVEDADHTVTGPPRRHGWVGGHPAENCVSTVQLP